MKNTQKGFGFIAVIIIIAVVAIGGVYYSKNQKAEVKEEMKVQMNAEVQNNAENGDESEHGFADSVIISAFGNDLKEEPTGVYGKKSEDGTNWIDKITKGDLNHDGYADAVVRTNSCGASCGSNLVVLLNKEDGTAEVVRGTFPSYITSSAKQTEIISLAITDNMIIAVGRYFEGDTSETIVTKKYKLEGKTIVEVK